MPIVSPQLLNWAWEPPTLRNGLAYWGLCTPEQNPVCLSTWIDPPIAGNLEIEAVSEWLDIASLMNEYVASDIVVNSFNFKALAIVPMGTTVDTRTKLYSWDGISEILEDEILTNYAGVWSDVVVPLSTVLASAGTPVFSRIRLRQHHYLDTIAGISQSVLAFGQIPTLNLTITTVANTSQVTFRVQNIDTGFDLPDVSVVGTGPARFAGTTNVGGTVTLTVYDGDNTASSRVSINGQWYSGATVFTAPVVGEVLIEVALEPTDGFVLPEWWYIPVIGVGGIIVLWAFLRRRKRKPAITLLKV